MVSRGAKSRNRVQSILLDTDVFHHTKNHIFFLNDNKLLVMEEEVPFKSED
jgi:hypothetical protein